MKIQKQDSNGVKPLLQTGELGYDNYPAGGDSGRVYVGTGSENIALAKKAEMLAVDGKADVHIARVDNPHEVTKEQVGLGNVENLAPADMPISSAGQAALNAKANKTELLNGALDVRYYTESEIDAKLDASEISYDGTVSALVATNVQDAVDEIKGSVDILDSAVVKLTGDQTIEDVKTFTSSPIVPTPTAVNQAVNKQYVDNMVISPNGSNSYAVAMAIVFGS